MRLLDFDFALPAGFTATVTSSDPEGTCVDIVGNEATALAGSIAQTAEAAGFAITENVPGRTELARGEQRLLLLFESSAVTLQIYDPSGLPMARSDGTAVLLGDFRVDFGSAAIVPLRERHTGDPQWLRAAWQLSGLSAGEIVGRVVDQAVASKGLMRGAVFEPPKGGRQSWSGEAYSKYELVKARAAVESDHVLLEIDLVDKRGNEQA